MTVNTNKYATIMQHETRANPQAIYNQMRAEDPIYCYVGPQTGANFWFFTRYADVQAVLRDQRFVMDIRKNLKPEYAARFLPEEEDPTFAAINRHLLNMDAPDHTRLRALVHKAFTPRRIKELLPRIEEIATRLLDDIDGQDEGDLIDDFAYPLPITVIAEMLGVHHERQADFRRWTRDILFEGTQDSARISTMEFVQYINDLIEERREKEYDDILGALVRVHGDDGETLDHMELLSMVFLLLVAGHETTVNLIGNGTLALTQHPEQRAKLAQDPDLIDSAIEEMLRYNGPVECPTWRWAKEDVEIGGVTIKEGDVVLPSLLGANRDPETFENPDTFDITRDPNPHVAFGFGAHYCLGAPLARMEGTIAINALLARYPNIDLNTEVDALEWNNSILLHGMKAMPVKYLR